MLDTLNILEVRVDGLEGEYGEFMVATKALIQDQVDSLRRESWAFHDELLKLRSFMQSEIQAIRAEVDEVHLVRLGTSSHSLLARLMQVWVTCQSHSRLIDLSKPDTYDGAHNAIIVDNLFSGLEQYFNAMSVRDEESKVGLHSYEAPYNYGAAKHGEIGNGICTINTWAEFQQELRKQFAPSNTEKE